MLPNLFVSISDDEVSWHEEEFDDLLEPVLSDVEGMGVWFSKVDVELMVSFLVFVESFELSGECCIKLERELGAELSG